MGALRLFLLLCCLAAPFVAGAAGAREITVRGGVHADFNRLVFDFPQAPHYSLARQPDGSVAIAVQGPAITLRPDGLAARLSRIADLASAPTADGTVLRFRVAPKAALHDFLSGTSLVIDVQGDPVAATALPVAAASAPAIAAPAAPVTTDAPSASATPAVPVQADIPAVLYERAGSSIALTPARQKIIAPPGLATVVETPAGLSGWQRPGADGSVLVFAQANDKAGSANGPGGQGLILAALLPVASQAPALTVNNEPGYVLGGRLLVKGAEGTTIPGPVTTLVDPNVGDQLIVVPGTLGQGLPVRQRFAAFELLPSRQGLVIRPLSDRVQVRLAEGGVEITMPGGLALSATPPLPPPAVMPVPVAAPVQAVTEGGAADTAAAPQLLPLDQWQAGPNESFTEARRRLQDAAAAAVPEERAKPRLDLARFYLASGYGEEAAGLLKVIAAQDPDLDSRPDYRGFAAMAQVLSGVPDQAAAAAQALAAPVLNGYEDVPLWRAAALAESNDFAAAAPLFAQNLDLLGRLREPLCTRFSDLAVEAFLATGDNDRATRTIDALVKRGGAAALRRPSVLYARGVLQSRIGSLDQARALWEQAAASDDQLARSRAGIALTALGLADKSLTPVEAATRLERLRYGWRGDSLELDLLRRLAEAYTAAGQLDEAIGALERAKRIAPDDQVGIAALDAQQRRIFADLFLGPALKDTPALKTLSTYRRYKQYAPVDPAQAQAVDDRLLDKMLAIDLLGPAAELLDGEIARAADPSKKARLGARSAGLRLLNGEADQAIKALDGSETPGLPAELLEERRLLRARALADEAQNEAALALLGDDSNPDAQRLTATIAWRAHDWPRAAAALAALLPAPDALKDKASDEQAQLILRRAVALSLANDTAGLAQLYASYGKAVIGTPQQAGFALLVAPESAGTDRSLTAVQGELKDVDLFKGFLDSYRK